MSRAACGAPRANSRWAERPGTVHARSSPLTHRGRPFPRTSAESQRAPAAACGRHEQSIHVKRRKLNHRLWEGTSRALVGLWDVYVNLTLADGEQTAFYACCTRAWMAVLCTMTLVVILRRIGDGQWSGIQATFLPTDDWSVQELRRRAKMEDIPEEKSRRLARP